MRTPRTAFTIFIIFVFGLALIYPQEPLLAEQTNPQTDNKVSFLWAFGAIKRTNQELQFTKITRDTELKSGDQLKMLVRLNKRCFVYVFHYGAQGQMQMLLPYNLDQFSTDYETSKNYYIPQGNFVLELDDKIGQEKFYLLASAKRLQELENLFGSYESADEFKKPESIENIIKEIKQLRNIRLI